MAVFAFDGDAVGLDGDDPVWPAFHKESLVTGEHHGLLGPYEMVDAKHSLLELLQ